MSDKAESTPVIDNGAAAPAEPNSPSSTSEKEEVVLTGDALIDAVRKQVEYYFSKENLQSDPYLTSQMDAQMSVPIAVVMKFAKLKALTQDETVLRKALEKSTLSLINDAATGGARIKANIKATGRSTIILREIPSDAPEAEVKEIFNFEGCKPINSIKADVENTWFVHMDKEEDAKDTLLDLRLKKRTFRGVSVKARLKTESVVRSFYPVQTAAPSATASGMYGGMPMVPMAYGAMPGQMGSMGVPQMGGAGTIPFTFMGANLPANMMMAAPGAIVDPATGAVVMNPAVVVGGGEGAAKQGQVPQAQAAGKAGTEGTGDQGSSVVTGKGGHQSGTNSPPGPGKKSGKEARQQSGKTGGSGSHQQGEGGKRRGADSKGGQNAKAGSGAASGKGGPGSTSAGGGGSGSGGADGHNKKDGGHNKHGNSTKGGAAGGGAHGQGHGAAGQGQHANARTPIIEINVADFPPLAGADETPIPSAGYQTKFLKYSFEEIISIVKANVKEAALPAEINPAMHPVAMTVEANKDLLKRQRSFSIDETREQLRQGKPVQREAVLPGKVDPRSLLYGDETQTNSGPSANTPAAAGGKSAVTSSHVSSTAAPSSSVPTSTAAAAATAANAAHASSAATASVTPPVASSGAAATAVTTSTGTQVQSDNAVVAPADDNAPQKITPSSWAAMLKSNAGDGAAPAGGAGAKPTAAAAKTGGTGAVNAAAGGSRAKDLSGSGSASTGFKAGASQGARRRGGPEGDRNGKGGGVRGGGSYKDGDKGGGRRDRDPRRSDKEGGKAGRDSEPSSPNRPDVAVGYQSDSAVTRAAAGAAADSVATGESATSVSWGGKASFANILKQKASEDVAGAASPTQPSSSSSAPPTGAGGKRDSRDTSNGGRSNHSHSGDTHRGGVSRSGGGGGGSRGGGGSSSSNSGSIGGGSSSNSGANAGVWVKESLPPVPTK